MNSEAEFQQRIVTALLFVCWFMVGFVCLLNLFVAAISEVSRNAEIWGSLPH